ncbi:TetR/AcrR family transcriptional regulator [Nocardioides marinquilinus]|uniref:TetR/AcrR family transcriptional regulator n=1 Tax=Nocardioides marinquilinus TaxID=1210400 RepID=A0ABP9PWD8_9ACTN
MSTREAILTAAQRHLTRHPAASMADLAAAAGVGRATVHRHFAGRDELLGELGARSLDRWEHTLDHAGGTGVGPAATADAEQLRACLDDLMTRYVADSDDFGFALTDTFLLGSAEHSARAQALFEREVAFYEAAQRAGVLRDDVPAVWIGHAVYGLLVAAREALRLGDVPRRGLDRLVLTTVLQGGAA